MAQHLHGPFAASPDLPVTGYLTNPVQYAYDIFFTYAGFLPEQAGSNTAYQFKRFFVGVLFGTHETSWKRMSLKYSILHQTDR